MASGPILLVPYDPSWPARFERERARIVELMGDVDAAVEHVGSTAVPQLGGKPILDILVGAPTLSEIDSRIPAFAVHDYEYVPEHEAQIPERRYFRKSQGGVRTQHVHAVVHGSSLWRNHLLFRDYLRAHPDAASDYWKLKQELAARHRTDRRAYTEGKSEFVESVLARAAEWRGVG